MRTLLLAILLSILFIAALPSTAHTGGFNLTWGTGCWRDNPSTLQTFACDSNDGSMTFTVSFVLSRDRSDFTGMAVLLDLQSDSPNLPDWWQLTDPGGCRSGALSASTDFTSSPGGCANPWPESTGCILTWITADFPSIAWPEVSGSSRVKLTLGCGFDAPFPSLSAGIEYYGVTITINHQQTQGLGECSGCNVPSTLVLNTVEIVSPLLIKLTTPIDNMCLRWQADGTTPCSATPVQNRTWGQVKSLYR